MTIRRVVQGEAIAYFLCGVLTSTRARSRIRHSASEAADLPRVLFVHGVGANASQFAPLRRALEGEARSFDAFEYSGRAPIRSTAAALAEQIESSGEGPIVAVGHSLGGLVLRMVLQSEAPPEKVAGFVSICAPLHGTKLARIAPQSSLRSVAPGGDLVDELHRTRDRLDRLKGFVLAIGSKHDHFVVPASSAFLDGHDRLELTDAGHVRSLFDPRVHGAIRDLVRRVAVSG